MQSTDCEGNFYGNCQRRSGGLLGKLPNDCSPEDIQYHLYVLEKVRNGIAAAESEGTVPQENAEARLSKWLTE
jgi:hypothetical protein